MILEIINLAKNINLFLLKYIILTLVNDLSYFEFLGLRAPADSHSKSLTLEPEKMARLRYTFQGVTGEIWFFWVSQNEAEDLNLIMNRKNFDISIIAPMRFFWKLKSLKMLKKASFWKKKPSKMSKKKFFSSLLFRWNFW